MLRSYSRYEVFKFLIFFGKQENSIDWYCWKFLGLEKVHMLLKNAKSISLERCVCFMSETISDGVPFVATLLLFIFIVSISTSVFVVDMGRLHHFNDLRSVSFRGDSDFIAIQQLVEISFHRMRTLCLLVIYKVTAYIIAKR